jgi:phospholipid/cholesterol/gamma-HCH transport system substrate-binding protein
MKKSRIQQMSMEVTVGAFMFMVLLALGVFTIILSSENIFTKKHHVEVVFDDVVGLRDGDNVLVRGLKVGKVHKLWLEQDGVHLTLSTEEPMQIHEDYAVEILPSSVLGGRYLQVSLGSPELPMVAEGELLRGTPPVDLIDEATETFGRIKEALVEGGILDNLKVMMADLRTLTRGLSEGEGTLGKLLSDDDAYNRFVAVAENLEDVTGRLRDGEGTIGRLLTDDTLSQDLEAAVANLKDLSQRLADGQGLLGKLLSEDDTAYEDLREVIASMREVSESLRAGEGTLGKLLTDDALYEEVNLLVREVRAAVDDVRETAPITTFTSIFFGAF